MKKLIKITESDLSNIVRKVILEMMDDSPKKLSFDGWADVWRKLKDMPEVRKRAQEVLAGLGKGLI